MSFLERLATRVIFPDASLAPRRPVAFETSVPGEFDGAASIPGAVTAVAAAPDPAPAARTPAASPEPLATPRDRAEAALSTAPTPSRGSDQASLAIPARGSATVVAVEHRETVREMRVETTLQPVSGERAAPPFTERAEESARPRTAEATVGSPPWSRPKPTAPAASPSGARAAVSLAPPPPPVLARSHGVLASKRQTARSAPPVSAAAAPPPGPAPVHITIGRIEVRAPAAAAVPPRKAPPAPTPVLSLADYLGKRGARE